MGNLLGEPFRPYVNSQIKIRQEVQGSGTNNTNRTLDEIAYLNSRNAWVKFASAVYIDEKRLQLLKNSSKGSLVNPMVENALEGFDLAIRNVLYNGLTPLTADGYSSQDAKDFTESFNKNLRYKFTRGANKFIDYNSNLNKSGIEGFQGTTRDFAAYGVGGIDFGFSPMPGITSVNIKDLNRGSIKKATINIKAHNRNQFDVIDLLYLRLGYTVCLEYGNNIYFDYEPEGSDNKVLKKVEDTLIDRYFWTTIRESYADFSNKINDKRKEYKGNYDGIIGVVSNFNWSFESDGTYNITVEVTSVGDVIESLRVNLPPLVNITTSANAQNKYNAIKDDLAKRKAGKQEFYQTLYPGLEDELTRIYDILTKNGSEAIFNYERKTAGGRGGYYVLNIPDNYNLEELKVRPAVIQDIDGGQKLVTDSQISQNSQWLLNFYDSTLTQGTINVSPLHYTTPTKVPDYNPKPIVLVYNEDGTSIIDTLQPPGTSSLKPDWLDNQTNDFKTIYPNGGFYVVIGAGRDNYREFNLTRRGLGYFDSSPVSVEEEEYKDGYTKYFNELTTPQKNLAFPKIFTKDALLNKFYYTNILPAGGERDKRFNPSSNTKEESPLETFRNKLETGKYKNKINNWFYNIRKYYDSAFLLDEKDNSDEAQAARESGKLQIESLKKIELRNFAFREAQGEKVDDFSNTIGYQLNPSENTPIWDQEIKSPSSTSPTCDLVKLKITPIEHSYFVRLGTLLEYIQNRIIFKMDSASKNSSSSPYFNIDTNIKTNICYAIDNMISTNVKKCIIRNDKFFVGAKGGVEDYAGVFKGLEPFFPTSNNTGYFYGQLMNVYLNFNRIEEIFDSVDEKNEIVLFDVLKAICNDINECLGSVNNIEPIIDRESNTIKLIDQTSIPGLDIIASQLGDNIYEERKRRKEEQEELIVFGYNQNNDKSNFIRSVGMTTEISKNYATAITIGATAQGEVPGMEATAFSRWNVGIRDRFKNRLFDAETPQDEIDAAGTGSLDKQNKSVIENYADFISDGYVTLGLNKPDSIGASINDGYISENKNTVKNYYVYAQAKTTEENYKEEGDEGAIESSIGFLPINLKLEMDGIGGIRIYDFVKINTAFLPSNYPNTLEFICTGVNHKLENDEWITSLDTLATSISKKT